MDFLSVSCQSRDLYKPGIVGYRHYLPCLRVSLLRAHRQSGADEVGLHCWGRRLWCNLQEGGGGAPCRPRRYPSPEGRPARVAKGVVRQVLINVARTSHPLLPRSCVFFLFLRFSFFDCCLALVAGQLTVLPCCWVYRAAAAVSFFLFSCFHEATQTENSRVYVRVRVRVSFVHVLLVVARNSTRGVTISKRRGRSPAGAGHATYRRRACSTPPHAPVPVSTPALSGLSVRSIDRSNFGHSHLACTRLSPLTRNSLTPISLLLESR